MHPCQDDMLNYVSTHRLLATIVDTEALGPTLHWERKSVSLKEGRKVPLQKSSRCDLPQTLLAARSPYQQINCTAISARTPPIPPLVLSIHFPTCSENNDRGYHS